jgi:hypothetical protein
MIQIIYFSGDPLLNGVSKKRNNLKLSCLSQGAVEEQSRTLVIAFKSELQSVRVFGLEGICNS